jgi:hypothetical protein
MCSKDVAEVYAQLSVGALVRIIPDSLPNLPKLKGNPSRVIFTADAPEGRAVLPVANSAPDRKTSAPRQRVSAAAPRPSGSGA